MFLFFHRNVHDALDKFVSMVKWQTTVACGFDSVVMWNFLQNHGMRRGICLGDADSRDALIALLPCRLGYTARQIDYTNLHKPHGKPSLTPWSFWVSPHCEYPFGSIGNVNVCIRTMLLGMLCMQLATPAGWAQTRDPTMRPCLVFAGFVALIGTNWVINA